MSRHGELATSRPARYAKQLAQHWSEKAEVTQTERDTTLRFPTGEVVILTPGADSLGIDVQVPDAGSLEGFSQVVADHLLRFGQREDVAVHWDGE